MDSQDSSLLAMLMEEITALCSQPGDLPMALRQSGPRAQVKAESRAQLLL